MLDNCLVSLSGSIVFGVPVSDVANNYLLWSVRHGGSAWLGYTMCSVEYQLVHGLHAVCCMNVIV